MSPYWERARAFARENSKTFGPWKAIPSILTAILAGMLHRYLHLLWSPIDIIIVVGCGLVTYFLCYGVDFLWKLLVVAPVKLDAARTLEIDKLQKAINKANGVSLVERSKRETVARKIAEIPEPFREPVREILKHLIQHGEVHQMSLIGDRDFGGANRDRTHAAISQAAMRALLVDRNSYISVSPELKDALTFQLFERSQG